MSNPSSREQLKDWCLHNKYYNWYMMIIEKAQNRSFSDCNLYCEKHHILPKSLLKNNDTILLTAREHFVCHLLLPKMLKNKQHVTKMQIALHRLVHGNKYDVYCKSSKSYEILKTWHSAAASERSREFWNSLSKDQRSDMRRAVKNGRYGKAVSEETRMKISKANKGRLSKENHPLWKVGHSEETKKKVSASKRGKGIGKKWFNNGHCEKFDYPENKPMDFFFGRLKGAVNVSSII